MMKTGTFLRTACTLCLGILLTGLGCSSGNKSSSSRVGPAAQPALAGQIHTHVLASQFEGVPTLVIPMPANYVLERVDDQDFQVFYLRDKKLKAGLGFYVGENPVYHYLSDQFLSVRREAGLLGSRTVDWRRYEKKGGLHSETIIKDAFQSFSKAEGDLCSRLMLHIFIAAPSIHVREQLEAAAGRLNVQE